MATRTKKTNATVNGLDLSAGQQVMKGHEDGVTVELIDHLGQPLTYTDSLGEEKRVWARFAGQYSARYAKTEREIRDRRWDAGEFRLSPEQREADESELHAAMLIDWGGFSDAGEPLKPSPENCLRFMQLPWIRPQFIAAVRGRTGFFGSSSGD